MLGKWRFLALAALMALMHCQLAIGQQTTVTVLEIEVENFVTYFNDVTDFSNLATDANKTALAVQARNFAQSIGVGDIVEVNGKRVQGVLTERRTQLNRTTSATAGRRLLMRCGTRSWTGTLRSYTRTAPRSGPL